MSTPGSRRRVLGLALALLVRGSSAAGADGLHALTARSQDALLAWVRAVAGGERPATERPDGLPGELTRPGPEAVVVSLVAPGRPTLAGMGRGEDLADATAAALRHLAARHGPELSPGLARERRVRLERLGPRRPLGPLRPGTLTRGYRPGVDGLYVRGYETETWFLPAAAMEKGLVPAAGLRLRELAGSLLAGLGPAGAPPEARLEAFETRAIVEDGDGRAVELARGFPPAADVTMAGLTRSLARLAGYLARAQRPDGRFRYRYDPVEDALGSGDNEVRQAAVAMSCWELLPALPPGHGLAKVAKRALAGLVRDLAWEPLRAGGEAALPRADREGGPSLGAVALLLRALAVAPAALVDAGPGARAWAGLGRTLSFMQRPDGSWYPDWAAARAGRPPAAKPVFYPGEALLALAEAAARDPGGPWLALARKSAARELEDLARGEDFDHWTVQALARYGVVAGDAAAARTAVRLAHELSAGQLWGDDASHPQDQGAFTVEGTITLSHAACVGEALGGAREAAWRFGIDPRRLEARLVRLARFLMTHQFTDPVAWALPGGPAALGGFPLTPTDWTQRIDNDGHVARALLATWATLAGVRPVPALADAVAGFPGLGSGL